jgi:hypothetical protein
LIVLFAWELEKLLNKGGFKMNLFQIVYWTIDDQASSFVDEKNEIEAENVIRGTYVVNDGKTSAW